MPKIKKGISAIFGEDIEHILDEIDGKIDSKEPATNIKVENIVSNPYQPRKHFNKEKLNELALSFSEHGVFTPIIVRPATQGKYYLIAGERRTRAAKLAGLKTIPAIVKDIDDNQMQEIALLENIQREDLNPIEEAMSYKSIMEKQKLTQETLAKKVGKSRSFVANTLRVLNLHEKILKYVIEGKLSFGHVKPLITLDPDLALKIANRAFDNNLTVREVESIVQGYQLSSNPKKRKVINENHKYVEGLIRKVIKSKVTVKDNKIIIPFKDDNSLNRILERLNLLEDE
jgi:ParB family chromosome partitioning protein